MGSKITLGLAQIVVGTAAPGGTMPNTLSKLGKAYKDSCKMTQDKADVTEHYEEGSSAPEVKIKNKKMPVFTFSIMDPDAEFLSTYIGGTYIDGKWGFDGTEDNANAAIQIQTEQGLWFDIPNGDIEANINAEFSKKGILLVDFTVTPMAVTSNKPFYSYDPATGLEVTPTALSFTAAADSIGKTVTASSTGNVTYAAGPSDAEWLTVTRAAKVVTVKVAANTNSEERTANVTIKADGKNVIVPVTQAGA
jgi:hypothetical protein